MKKITKALSSLLIAAALFTSVGGTFVVKDTHSGFSGLFKAKESPDDLH